MIEDGSTIADIDLKLLREDAEIMIRNEPFQIRSKGILKPEYSIEAFDTVVARASRPSGWKRRYEIDFAGKRFELTPIKWYLRTFVMRRLDDTDSGSPEIGRVEAVKWYRQSARAVFSEELPIAVDVFSIALVLLAWQRAAKSN